MKINKIVKIDFDGTITRDNNYPHCGELMPGADVYIKLLHDVGCTIILDTCRVGKALDDAVAYCKLHKIPLDYVNENVPEVIENHGHDSRKIFANYSVDDLNFGGFPGWAEVYTGIYADAFYEQKGAV
jgi:hypothetical protein